MIDPRHAVLLRTGRDGGATASASPRSARLHALARLNAAQQPPWERHCDLEAVRAALADLPPLVRERDIDMLRRELARVEAREAYLLHIGECAETFPMASARQVERRVSLYRRMAAHLADRTGRDVVLVTRMAGQHGKPRSQPTEIGPDGSELPVYRGDAVNGPVAAISDRQPDPRRLLTSYQRSWETLEYLRTHLYLGHPVYVSHEALIRDYELPMTRGDAMPYATSAHLVWIGDRTRQVRDWHIQWASLLANPVGVKIGPTASHRDVVGLLEALNPRGERGRLTLIARMGADGAVQRLGALARTVLKTRVPVLWQCDPMHGNTRKVGITKLRLLSDLRAEISAFVQILRRAGLHPGGLHLEVTPDDVRECAEVAALAEPDDPIPPCDPRLNPAQAMALVDFFATQVGSGDPRGWRG